MAKMFSNVFKASSLGTSAFHYKPLLVNLQDAHWPHLSPDQKCLVSFYLNNFKYETLLNPLKYTCNYILRFDNTLNGRGHDFDLPPFLC